MQTSHLALKLEIQKLQKEVKTIRFIQDSLNSDWVLLKKKMDSIKETLENHIINIAKFYERVGILESKMNTLVEDHLINFHKG